MVCCVSIENKKTQCKTVNIEHAWHPIAFRYRMKKREREREHIVYGVYSIFQPVILKWERVNGFTPVSIKAAFGNWDGLKRKRFLWVRVRVRKWVRKRVRVINELYFIFFFRKTSPGITSRHATWCKVFHRTSSKKMKNMSGVYVEARNLMQKFSFYVVNEEVSISFFYVNVNVIFM